MNYEVEIQKLNERVAKLEAAENKRILKRRIEIWSKIVIALVVVIILVVGYIYINNKYIKPYKEKLDSVNEKVENVENFVDEKWESLKKYNPFSKSN